MKNINEIMLAAHAVESVDSEGNSPEVYTEATGKGSYAISSYGRVALDTAALHLFKPPGLAHRGHGDFKTDGPFNLPGIGEVTLIFSRLDHTKEGKELEAAGFSGRAHDVTATDAKNSDSRLFGQKIVKSLIKYLESKGAKLVQVAESLDRASAAPNPIVAALAVSREMTDIGEAKKINFDREVWEGWTVGDFIKELELAWKYKKWNNPTKPEMAKWLSSEQPSYKKRIPEVVAYFWDKYQKQKNESVDEELTTDELRREYRGRFAEVDGTAVRIDSKEGVASLVDNTGENALEEAFVPGIAWTQDAELKSLIKVGLRAKAADGAAKNRKLFKTFEKAFFDKPHPQGLKVMEMLFNIAKSLDSNDAPTTVPMFKTLQQRLKLMQTAERATGGGKTEALTTDELRREYRGRYAEVDGTAVRIDSKEGVASLVDNTGEELLELEWAELHACACERKKEVEGKTITLDIPAAITRKATTRIKRPVDVGPGSLDKDLPESIEESRKITPLNNDYRKAVLLISTLQGKLTTDGYTLLGAIGTDTKLTAAHMRKAKLDGPAFKAAVSDLQKHTVLSLVGKSVFPEITAAFKAMGAGPPKEEDTDV